MALPRLLRPVSFVALLALGLAAARQEDAAPRMRAEPVAGAVSVLYGEGGNIGVSYGADGVLLVDDQFERVVLDIQRALAGIAGDEVRAQPLFLLNTHHHGDHTGSNAYFGQMALIVAHANVRARLQDEDAKPQALPVVTYEQGLSLHVNGEEVRVLHVPAAHTDGDSVVWFTGSKVVHLGDLYFQLGYPFVDTASGGNVVGLIEGLRALLPRLPADVRVIPGHGTVTGKAELEEYVAMLETITERVRAGVAEGKDAAALVAAGVTRDYDARWGNFAFVPPERFVASVVASVR